MRWFEIEFYSHILMALSHYLESQFSAEYYSCCFGRAGSFLEQFSFNRPSKFMYIPIRVNPQHTTKDDNSTICAASPRFLISCTCIGSLQIIIVTRTIGPPTSFSSSVFIRRVLIVSAFLAAGSSTTRCSWWKFCIVRAILYLRFRRKRIAHILPWWRGW